MTWRLFPVLGTAACVGFFFCPAGRAADAVFVAIGAISVAAVAVGIQLHRPLARTAWILIAAGSALWLLGDAAFFSISLDHGVVPMPSSADIVYLVGYPVLAMGLYLLVHRGWRRGQSGHVANSAIVMIAFGLLLWVFVVHPAGVDVSTVGGLIGVAYPAMDVFLLGLLVHFVGSVQWQSPAFRLLTAAVIAVLLADIVANAASGAITVDGPAASDVGYLAYYVLVGTAALHPSMRRLAPAADARRSSVATASFNMPTVLVLTAATLTAPGAMGILLARGEPVTDWGWGVVLCATLLVCLVFMRITELLRLLHRQARTLEGVADTDHLTGLLNRHGLETWIDRTVDDRTPITLLLLGIDRFREINETFGYSIGDDVLRVVAGRLRSVVGTRGAVCRLGADEFAVAMYLDDAAATAVAHEMQASLHHAVDVRRATLLVEASIGIASEPVASSSTTEILVQHANLAMQSAKARPPRITSYDPSMDRDNTCRLLLLSELTAAIDGRELELYYQVQVDLATMEATGVEALLRWNHPTRGLLDPDTFLPMAERTGLIRPLLDYVLAESLAQQRRWQAADVHLTMSINISTRNLLDVRIVEQIRRATETAGTAKQGLTIEITETSSMTDPPVAIASLDELRLLGITLAIDDYGTGYSSLSYLQRLPVQQLKIDKTFVTDLTTTQAHRVIVRSTIDLAKTLGLTVTAEGVEDLATLLELESLGCDHAQGYYLGRPMPAEDIPKAVAELNAQLTGLTEVS